MFFALLRNIYAAICIVLERKKSDVIFVDQISASIPILALTGAKVRDEYGGKYELRIGMDCSESVSSGGGNQSTTWTN